MYLLTVAVITMCAGLVYGQSSQCLKPDGKSDKCISLLKCKPLREQLDKPNKTDQDLFLLSKSLTKLHCGSIRVPFLPKVCCPEQKSGQRIKSPPPCKTPDGQPGECINLFSCPHFKNLLQPPVPQEVITFVQSYRCVGPEEHSVCCGPAPTTPRTTTFRTTTAPELDRLDDPGEPAECQALMTTFPPNRSSECCGVIRKSFDGISPSILYQHPWAVLIEYGLENHKKICAGTLISARYVLTGAICVTRKDLENGTPISVRLGEYDLDYNDNDCIFHDVDDVECNDKPISIAIETIIAHPHNNDPASMQDDIALIRLKEAAPYTDFIRPICLPTKNLLSRPPESPLVAVSWFKEWDYKGEKMLVEAPFVDQEKCQKGYGSRGGTVKVWKGRICAGIKSVDNCNRDNGAPLVYENQGRSELIGTVSFGGYPCYRKDFPGVYTNIYEYIDWIKSHIVA